VVSACGASPDQGGSAAASGALTRVALVHVPHGEAQLSYDSVGGSLTVAISVTGLAPDSIHPAHIHRGTCAQQGRILYPLSPVSANPTGMAADRTSTVPHIAEAGIPASGWYINIHNGPEMAAPQQAKSIACGDVANPARANAVSVGLMAGAAGTPDQAAGGSAELSLDGGHLRVLLRVHGLAPGSAHLARLHMGSCEAQSRALASLGTLTADSHGEARQTSTISEMSALPSPMGYVIVHRGMSEDTQSDADPILCGNVGG